MGDDILFRRYLDAEKTFHERKFPMKDALRLVTEIKAVATKELIEMVWHNIGKVKTLYAGVLLVDLGDIAPVAKRSTSATISCIGMDGGRTGRTA